MQALKAIPGFTSFLKGFMKVWDERVDHIVNLSSNLRVGENQLKEYYDMLPPICDKLGIAVPELYIQQDVEPNAYTWGDENPFIVMTSGLLDLLPEELIPSVLAHECGHIACHHALYTTMGNLILGGVHALPGLASMVTVPLQTAFYYWMRCSEFSADRASVAYTGSWEPMAKVCMYFAGYNQGPISDESLAAFMEQAGDYEQAARNSRWDHALEFVLQNGQDHPFVAVRASACKAWAESEQYAKTIRYLAGDQKALEGEDLETREIPIAESPKYYLGKNYNDVREQLIDEGFTHISTVRLKSKENRHQEGQVLCIRIDGEENFEKNAWFPEDASIVLTYNEPVSPEEEAAAHAGCVQLPENLRKYRSRDYRSVVEELRGAGFEDIAVKARAADRGRTPKDFAVRRITVDGEEQLDKGDWIPQDAKIRIWYQPEKDS